MEFIELEKGSGEVFHSISFTFTFSSTSFTFTHPLSTPSLSPPRKSSAVLAVNSSRPPPCSSRRRRTSPSVSKVVPAVATAVYSNVVSTSKLWASVVSTRNSPTSSVELSPPVSSLPRSCVRWASNTFVVCCFMVLPVVVRL